MKTKIGILAGIAAAAPANADAAAGISTGYLPNIVDLSAFSSFP